ncbi:BAHD acyltransferase BIA1 [Camellia lanceoleosa]|uniref:BAHD acyltransferase BIA1 n=1 Tax=Camellia lanceoleosa TaxID=1840588 RepID=A0ACC0HH10_9ERIC|nr:BAHD acyltransferase BIA1 [Camellia lanceoleosa]
MISKPFHHKSIRNHRRRYVFNASKLHALKAEAANARVQQPTRMEAIMALLWKCATDASRSRLGFGSTNPRRPSILVISADMRERLVPPLLESSFGNIGRPLVVHADDESENEMNLSNLGKRANEEDSQARKLRVRTVVTMVFNKPIYRILSEIRDKPFVQWPAKLEEAQRGFDNRYRCTFHDEKGHQIKNYTPLRQHLQELVVTSHLDQYIEGRAQPALQDRNRPNGTPADGLPQGIINVIHGIIEHEQYVNSKR